MIIKKFNIIDYSSHNLELHPNHIVYRDNAITYKCKTCLLEICHLIGDDYYTYYFLNDNYIFSQTVLTCNEIIIKDILE